MIYVQKAERDMSSSVTRIREEVGRGTRGGSYVYVVEGSELVHISEYSIRKLPGKFEDEIVYEVPIEKLIGKQLYCFDFSRSGNIFIRKCKIEDFEDGRPREYEFTEVHEIRNLRFRVKDPALVSLLSEFNELFIPMINEIEDYEEILNFKCRFMGHQRRLEEAFEDPELYYFAFMSLPNDKSRIKSLKATKKWIYQIWILKLICEALNVSKFVYHDYNGEKYWWIEQGSEFSTCIGETPYGNVSFWIEFQPSKGAHLLGLFAGIRVPIRPDIVVVRGYYETTEDFVESKKAIDVIVECKENPFIEWRNEINSQILPYLHVFKPRLFILASLQPVPSNVKEYLKRVGVEVVDNLRPRSSSIGTLHEILHL